MPDFEAVDINLYWDHDDVVRTLVFRYYDGNKENHLPLTFYRDNRNRKIDVYLGHPDPGRLDKDDMSGCTHLLFTRDDWGQVVWSPGSPIVNVEPGNGIIPDLLDALGHRVANLELELGRQDRRIQNIIKSLEVCYANPQATVQPAEAEAKAKGQAKAGQLDP